MLIEAFDWIELEIGPIQARISGARADVGPANLSRRRGTGALVLFYFIYIGRDRLAGQPVCLSAGWPRCRQFKFIKRGEFAKIALA